MPRQRKLLKIGDRYGRLKVYEHTEPVIGVRTRSIFKCDCGKICEKDNYEVTSGKIQSCGCYQRECASKLASVVKEDLTGREFGRWKVLLRVSSILYPHDQSQQPIKYLCKCKCGKTRMVNAHALRDGTSKSCGCGINRRKKSNNES